MCSNPGGFFLFAEYILCRLSSLVFFRWWSLFTVCRCVSVSMHTSCKQHSASLEDDRAQRHATQTGLAHKKLHKKCLINPEVCSISLSLLLELPLSLPESRRQSYASHHSHEVTRLIPVQPKLRSTIKEQRTTILTLSAMSLYRGAETHMSVAKLHATIYGVPCQARNIRMSKLHTALSRAAGGRTNICLSHFCHQKFYSPLLATWLLVEGYQQTQRAPATRKCEQENLLLNPPG